MKELHELLEYINYYEYSKTTEEILFAPGPYHREAKKKYEDTLQALETFPEPSAFFMRYPVEADKWAIDIAIDCVRQMSEEDRDYVVHHQNDIEYHFGYAMWIRNEYIHSSKNHFCLIPDSESSKVMEIIFSIVDEKYDYREENNRRAL